VYTVEKNICELFVRSIVLINVEMRDGIKNGEKTKQKSEE
jgi:hypothetical protein